MKKYLFIVLLVGVCFGQKDYRELHVMQAKKMLANYDLINKQVPTLSPSEKKWLDKEVLKPLSKPNSVYTRRILSGMDSKEYQIHVVNTGTEDIISYLNQIIDRKDLKYLQEIEIWIILVKKIIDFNYWQSMEILIDMGIIKEDSFGIKKATNHLANQNLQAEYIIDNIILRNPLLWYIDY
tara:strand:+ start:376 stop:918 length:543 start_codon:yes stop_codon:yes gene_type:complete